MNDGGGVGFVLMYFASMISNSFVAIFSRTSIRDSVDDDANRGWRWGIEPERKMQIAKSNRRP